MEVYRIREESGSRCFGCSWSGHVINCTECPACGISCFQCGSVGHYAKWCKQKGAPKGRYSGEKVKSLEESGDDGDCSYLF